MSFKVGDLVLIARRTSPPGNTWEPFMDDAIGKVAKISRIQVNGWTDLETLDGSHPNWKIYNYPLTSFEPYVLGIGAELRSITPAAPQPQACNCPILKGCSCGAFKLEMEAKGRTYNKQLKCWMSQ